jgi:hypothetical protein
MEQIKQNDPIIVFKNEVCCKMNNNHFYFKKDVPIKSLDFYDLKRNFFVQSVPLGTRYTMFVKNGHFGLFNNIMVKPKKNNTSFPDSILNVIIDENENISVLDILYFQNRSYVFGDLSVRFGTLKEHFSNVIFPKFITNVSGNGKIRLLREKTINLLEFPSYMWECGGVSPKLLVTPEQDLVSLEGTILLKAYHKKLEHLIGKVVSIKIKGKNVIIKKVHATTIPDSAEYAKEAIQSIRGSFNWDDLVEFKKSGKITVPLNKKDLLLVNAITTEGSVFISYDKQQSFISLQSVENPTIVNNLSSIYDIKKNELLNKISLRFPNVEKEDIRKRIQSSFSKKDSIGFILNSRGCIICGLNDTVFRCKGCNYSIICKCCVEIMGDEKKYKCDFCNFSDKISQDNTDVLDDDNTSHIEHETFENDLSKLNMIYSTWMSEISNVCKFCSFSCEVSMNFGAEQKHYFNRLIANVPFKVKKYNIFTGKDTSKVVFMEGDQIVNCCIQEAYKKNIMKCIEEQKFGFRFKLKYIEKVPQDKQTIPFKSNVHVIEYSYKIIPELTLVLRSGNNNREMLIIGPDDTRVNEMIRKVLQFIF